MRLNSFRRNLKLQASAQADDSGDNGFVMGILLEISHEAAVDLDMVDRKLLQMRQGRIAGSEVVQSDLDAVLPEFGKGPRDVIRVSSEEDSLGHFDLEATRRNLDPVKRSQHVVDETRLTELSWRQVERDAAEWNSKVERLRRHSPCERRRCDKRPAAVPMPQCGC